MSSLKSVDPISTLLALLSVTIWSWATLVKSEAALVSTLRRERDGDTSVCGDINSVIGGHIAQLEFSSLAFTAWQTGGVAPFFFFTPYRRQYHSSDLSPFACLNVWKQDVLRLLALLGKAGMLIPHPRGARQYGAAWWPPASPGSHCHNTSHIPRNHRHHLLFHHTSITVAGWMTGAANRQSQGSSGWNENKKLLGWGGSSSGLFFNYNQQLWLVQWTKWEWHKDCGWDHTFKYSVGLPSFIKVLPSVKAQDLSLIKRVKWISFNVSERKNQLNLA